MQNIQVIDLFAGPGGLGEGFSSFSIDQGQEKRYPFSIAMSVEKEANAHRTLQLRAFFRKFKDDNPPEAYYEYLKQPKNLSREELFNLYNDEAEEAIQETFKTPKALGTNDDKKIIKRLKSLKNDHSGPRIVIGGPPCQAYSLVGRARNLGTAGYSAKNDHRHFLYREYLKVLSQMEPEVFVMENVKGILSSSVSKQKIFPQILNDLRHPSKALNKRRKGYRYRIYSLAAEPDDLDPEIGPIYKNGSKYVIRSEQHGTPQMRHRVILIGVREDIEKSPALLDKHSPVAIDRIIDGMPALRSGLSREPDGDREWRDAIKSIKSSLSVKLKAIEMTKQVRAIKNLPDDSQLMNRGGRFVSHDKTGFGKGFHGPLHDWIFDPRLKGFINHETRGHMRADLERYLWCSVYANLNMKSDHPSPKSYDFPGFLYPEHKNWTSGIFADRFRVQVQRQPATTITSHISKDGHYFIHYDPSQCRSLTVREAARIQTFPDNYLFEGNRTQQYVQVGNAVPPYLAKQIAERVYNLLT